MSTPNAPRAHRDKLVALDPASTDQNLIDIATNSENQEARDIAKMRLTARAKTAKLRY